MATTATELEKDVYSSYEEALRCIHAKQYSKAGTLLESIEREHPGETRLLANIQSLLRHCRSQLGKDTRPDSVEQMYDFGIQALNAGNLDQALQFFTMALKECEDESDYLYHALAAAEAKAGNSSKALQHLKKSIELNDVNRFTAQSDPDFESLFKNQEFQKLVRGRSR